MNRNLGFAHRHAVTLAIIGSLLQVTWPFGTCRLQAQENNELEAREVWDTTLKALVHSLAFSPDGKLVAAGTRDGMIVVLDAETGQETKSFRAHEKAVTQLAFDGKGSRVVSVGAAKVGARGVDKISVWDIEMGKEVSQIKPPGAVRCALQPDGAYVAVSIMEKRDDLIRLFNLSNGGVKTTLSAPKQMTAMALSSDGKWVVGVTTDQLLRVFDVENFKQLRDVYPVQTLDVKLCFSPCSKWIVCGEREKDIRVIEVANAKEVHRLKFDTRGLSHLAYSPDGKWIAAAFGPFNRPLLCHAASGEIVYTFKAPPANSFDLLAFSPDSNRLLAAYGTRVYMYHLRPKVKAQDVPKKNLNSTR